MELASFNLPEDWQIIPIREAYRFTIKPRGLSFGRTDTVQFIPMESIPFNRLRVSEFEKRAGSELTSGTYIENGDLIVAKITPSFENGKQAIVDWQKPFGFATTEVIPIQEIEGTSDKHFLYFLLLHPAIRSDLAGKMDGTTGRQRLSKEVLGSRLIPLPPLAEQRKIARVLGLVQRATEQQEQLMELTAELKKSLVQQLFTHGLRNEPQKQTEVGSIPQSWELLPLGAVVNLFGGFAFRSREAIPVSNTQLVRMGNLYANRLDLDRSPLFYPDEFAEKHRRFVLREGDLIMSLTGTSGKEDYGFVVEVPKLSRTLLLNQRVARVDLISSDLLKEFLFYFLRSRKFLDHLYPTAKGMKQANLSTNAMKNLLVLVPSLSEQREMVECLRALDAKLNLHRRKCAALRALFRTLLNQLITAQIRVDNFRLADLGSFNCAKTGRT